jgi:hypothetical protein
MYDAVELLEKGELEPKKIDNLGKIYTIPNFRQWVILNVKVFLRIFRYKFGLKNRPTKD